MPLRVSSLHKQSCVLHFTLVSYTFSSCVLATGTLDRRPQCHTSNIVNFLLCPAEPCAHLRVGVVTCAEIPCQMSPSSPRTRIKRIYALARVSAAQCADRDLCYTQSLSRVLTDFHPVLNLLVDTQCVRSRTFMRTWRHILYYSCRCVMSPFRQMIVLGAIMLAALNPRSTSSRDDPTPVFVKFLSLLT